MTQQVLSIKDSGANVILSANFPAPSGVLVSQLRQNGVNIPFVGGASLNLAVDANSIPNLTNLWASDDCVPELEKDKPAKKFVKAFTTEYGYPPNYASAQVYDAVNITANAVDESGSRPEGDQQGAGGDRLRRRLRLQERQEQRARSLGDDLQVQRADRQDEGPGGEGRRRLRAERRARSADHHSAADNNLGTLT